MQTVKSNSEMAARLRSSNNLIQLALPYIRKLFAFLDIENSLISLFDAHGYLLTNFGKNLASQNVFKEGDNFSIEKLGNNAVGLALANRKPSQVVREAHDHPLLKEFSSYASPIMNNRGQVECVLAVTLKDVHESRSIFGLLNMTSLALEKQMVVEESSNDLFLKNKIYSTLVESISDGLLMIDGEGVVIFLNKKGGEILRLDPGKIMGKKFGQVIHWGKPIVYEVLEKNKGYEDRELYLNSSKGIIHVIDTAIPIRNEGGKIVAVVNTFREIKRVSKLASRMIGTEVKFTFSDVIGESLQIRKAVEMGKLASKSNSPILIEGESGTGKELFAQAVHNMSERKESPFIPINCGAMPRELIESELFGYIDGAFTGAFKGGRLGKFEACNGGTIFLDEIIDLPKDMQNKLLRVIQEKEVYRIGDHKGIPVDVRVISSSNRDLAKVVESGDFREDLFYRLNVLKIYIPPLRERKEDIPLLTQHFVKKIAQMLNKKVQGVDPKVLQIFNDYPWPGNVRELQNIIERAINFAKESIIRIEDLQENLAKFLDQKPMEPPILDIRLVEKEQLVKALKLSHGNVAKTAKALGISRPTVYKKSKKYNINLERRK
jgi:transcriptional regulator with PAS, ATPase and Fis domain